VIEDTTVMLRAAAHLIDSRLLVRPRGYLVKLFEESGIALRQNLNREALRIAMQVIRYARAKQLRSMKMSLRTFIFRVVRVYRDICRQINRITESRQDSYKGLMHRVNRTPTQTTKEKSKLYALHAPKVECISKGKARIPNKFGVKESVSTALKEAFWWACARCKATPTTDTYLRRPLSRSVFLLRAYRRQS